MGLSGMGLSGMDLSGMSRSGMRRSGMGRSGMGQSDIGRSGIGRSSIGRCRAIRHGPCGMTPQAWPLRHFRLCPSGMSAPAWLDRVRSENPEEVDLVRSGMARSGMSDP